MRKIYLLLFCLIIGSVNLHATVCTASATQFGTDQSGFTATVTNFNCASPNTIVGASLDASIGANCSFGGGSLYYYNIYVNGLLVAIAQCDQFGFDLTPYLPLSSVSIEAADDPADGNPQAVTLNLDVHLTYFPPYTEPSGVTCSSGSSTVVFTDELESATGWIGNIGTTGGNWRLPNANPGGNSGGTGPNATHSGVTYAEFEASTAAAGTYSIVSPMIDLSSTTDAAELSFWMYAYGANMGTLNVGVGTSQGGPFTNEFSWVGQHQTSDSQPWSNIGVDLTAYLGQVIYLEFALTHDGSGLAGDMGLDLIEVTSCSSCPAPTALFASNVLGSSIQLNWTENGSATNWAIEYGPVGFTPGTGTLVAANSNPFTVFGLTPITSYDFYVKSDCVSDSSLNAGPLQVNTLVDNLTCGAGSASVLYSQDFEGGFPSDWSSTAFIDPQWKYNTGPTSTSNTGPSSAQLNSGYLYFETSGGVFGDSDTLFTPMIDLTAVVFNSRLVYYYHMFGNNTGNLKVDVSSDQSVWTNLFTQNGSVQTASTDPWIPAELDLTAYAGGPVWIRVIATRGSSFTGDIGLDNFKVEGCVTCPAPTQITVGTITQTSVDLSWLNGGTETNWIIEYGAPGFVPGSGTTVNSTTNPFNVAGLTDNTLYDFYVYADCGGSVSAPAGPVSATTDIYCTAPIFFNFEYAANDTVSLEWIATGSESSWIIDWGTTGFVPGAGSGTSFTTATIPDTIFNLPLGGVFDFYVQADCGMGVNNPWVGPLTYATPATNDLTCDFIPVNVDGVTTTYSNVGATVTVGEPTSGFNTVWFTFIAPPSGSVEIKTCGTDFDNFIELFESADCANFSLYVYVDGAVSNPFPLCPGVDAAGLNICHLTPGKTYYLAVGSENLSDEGIFPLTITEITQISAGTAIPQILCENVTAYSLFNAVSGNNSTNGQWYTPTVFPGNGISSTINLSGLAAGIHDFHYVEENACTSDTVYVPIEVVQYAQVGTGSFLPQTCNYGDLDLFAQLSGIVDLGGVWNDANGQAVGSVITYNGEVPGTYTYYYVVDNGVCPADSSNVIANLIDCLSLDEIEFITKIYPNPVQDLLNIELAAIEGQVNLELFTIQGAKLEGFTKNGNDLVELNMQNYSKGIYLLRISTSESTEEIRIIKE